MGAMMRIDLKKITKMCKKLNAGFRITAYEDGSLFVNFYDYKDSSIIKKCCKIERFLDKKWFHEGYNLNKVLL